MTHNIKEECHGCRHLSPDMEGKPFCYCLLKCDGEKHYERRP